MLEVELVVVVLVLSRSIVSLSLAFSALYVTSAEISRFQMQKLELCEARSVLQVQ